ncbi:hypothetical protein [Streptomyces sp. NPDC059080]|uniref:hypothetical protein n=1 Tax=Streptomyces sp. NPDC059080 TaxID=3346718 RepID=UPI0036C4D2A9
MTVRSSRSIHEVLDDAAIPDVFADFDLAASKRHMAFDLAAADAVRREAAAPRPAPGRRLPAPVMLTAHDRAGADLRALCTQALHRSDAADLLAKLANSRRIDPDGALHFGCLLHLAGCPEGAQFWWQFAAGAGNAAAAHCLHLLHLTRGELRDAAHWADQAAALAGGPTVLSRSRTAPPPDARQPRAALRAVVGLLTVGEDDEFGRVPHPDPCLADRLRELADAL